MTTETNKAIIREIYAALENGDPSVFGRYCDPDYVWRFPSKASWSKRFEGRTVVRAKLIGPLFSLFADTYKARLLNVYADGDTVIAEVEGKVTLKSGDIYDNQYCFLYRFRDGLVTEVVEYCDTDLEERVLGPYEAALKAFETSSANAG